MNHIKILTALTFGASFIGASLASQTAFAHNGKHQDVTVSIDARGYHPSTVSVQAGKEVHLSFVSKDASCGNTVVIPGLKQTVKLEKGQHKTIKFTPQKGQIIAFACPMKMFKGSVKAK